MSDSNPVQTERGGKFRLIFWMLLGLLLIGFGLHRWLNREPSYQGKPLTDWLETMDNLDGTSSEQREAILAMGPKAVPQLLKYLQETDAPTNYGNLLLQKSADWLSGIIGTKIYLPNQERLSQQAFTALQILGPQARSAIPDLMRMMIEDTNSILFYYDLGYLSANVLSTIGPEGIPALTNVLASTNPAAGFSALIALGEMGTNAASVIPLIGSLMQGTNPNLAGEAVLTLGEMGPAAQPFLPKIEQLLLDDKYCEPAAFALAKLGDLRPLASALTNINSEVQWAACSELCQATEKDGPYRFSFLSASYGGYPNRYRVSGPTFHPTSALIQPLAGLLTNSDPGLRALIAERLGEFGTRAGATIPALTKALADPDAEVRQKAAAALKKIDVTLEEGGIIRGPRREKKIVLEFTGHNFAEGGETILNELARHKARGSFYVTGDFLRNPEFTNLTHRMLLEGHYLGLHSDKHPLYCPWTGPKTNLVTLDQFNNDLEKNVQTLSGIKRSLSNPAVAGAPRFPPSRYWLPPFEWYNRDIADWSLKQGRVLVNYTPGTRSNADFTRDRDPNFVSSQAIFDSIVKKEREDPDGLNGFLLLFHLGAGPDRTDKFSARFGELLDYLSARGYQFVRIDEMMEGK